MKPNLREQHVGNTSDDNPRCLRSRKEIDRQSGSGPTDAVCLWLAVMWRCRSRVKLLEAQRKHRRKRVTARRCGDGKRAEESSHGGINAPPSDPSSASTGKGTRARGLPLFASITRYHHQEVGRPSRRHRRHRSCSFASWRRAREERRRFRRADKTLWHARTTCALPPLLGRAESGHRESPWATHPAREDAEETMQPGRAFDPSICERVGEHHAYRAATKCTFAFCRSGSL